jgi:chorismate-pyruvate lyase
VFESGAGINRLLRGIIIFREKKEIMAVTANTVIPVRTVFSF